MGLHFKPSANASYYLDVLLTAAANNSEKFNVYTPETMPERYHFAKNARIAPIYVIPNIGYVLTTHKEGDVGLSKGVSRPVPISVMSRPFVWFSEPWVRQQRTYYARHVCCARPVLYRCEGYPPRQEHPTSSALAFECRQWLALNVGLDLRDEWFPERRNL